LQKLFETGPSKDGIIPAINRQVRVFYDWKTFLTPNLNKNISNHQVPHVYRFKKIFGRCYMQYKLFSKYDLWLPKCPSGIVSVELLAQAPTVNTIQVMPLAPVGGFDSFAQYLGIPIDSMDSQSRILRRTSEIEAQLRDAYNHMINAESKAFAEDAKRLFQEEEHFGKVIDLRFQINNNELLKVETLNTNEEGYIFWLDNKGGKPTIDLNLLKAFTLDRRNGSHLLKAQAYSRVAATVIDELNNGHFGKAQDFAYELAKLTEAEIEFYESVDTDIKAISKHNQEVEAELGVPYNLFPLDHLSDALRTTLLTKKLSDFQDQEIAIGEKDSVIAVPVS